MTTGLKPSWQGLKTSQNFNNPVEEVVGQIVDWRIELDNFQNNQVILKFAQCQILKMDAPYPYPDWELSIKFSEHENSAWGFFGLSAAEALGTSIELLDIDLLKGRWAHVLRTPHDYGPDKAKESSPGVPARIMGVVYRIVKFIEPGTAVTSVAPVAPVAVAPVAVVAPVQAPAPIAAPVAMPAAQVMAPAVAPVAVPVAAAPVAVATAPVAVAEAPVAVVETPAIPGAQPTPEDQALTLLHGKDIASFFQVAVPDPIIRTDPALVNAIMSGVFAQAQITSGKVVKNDDGTHSVVGMA